MWFLNWKKSVTPAWIHCLIKRLHFLALIICEHNSCWLRSCTIYVTFLFSISVLVFILFSCLSFFFTLTDQFTDDDAPPLPWSVESDEQIIVAKTEGFPHLLFLLFCFVLSLLQGLLWSCLSFKSLVLCLFLSRTVCFLEYFATYFLGSFFSFLKYFATYFHGS